MSSLGSYGDGRSMRGSGIDALEYEYEAFTCEDEDCGKENPAGVVSTDDWGQYEVDCGFCGSTHETGDLRERHEEDPSDRDDGW